MPTAAAPKAQAPTFGGYQILRKIGAGGIAEIYLARQPSLDRQVAIKILSTRVMDDPDVKRRFDREALTIARLNHPNIIHVIDRGVAQGRYYFVMDFVDGDDLRALIKKRKLSVEEKCDIVVQSLKALDYAHKNGVIHRDIKPANILVDSGNNVRVADFGIAQLVDPERSDNTSTSVIMGTPAYMSPEQKVSSARVDVTTDLYALGVVFYELLTGEKPLGHFKPPSAFAPEVPPGLDAVICRALAQLPAERFQSAVEFKDAVLAAMRRAPSAGSQEGEPSVIREAAKFLGKCTFLDTIKEHPYGATYLVEDRDTNELFVIKKIVKRNSGIKEARLLARLKHPHIVHIFGAGADERRAVVLMAYARGGSLSDRLVRRMEPARVAALLDACLDGLEFAHNNHIVHGNLRPSNILFAHEDVPLLTDFGLPEHYGRNQANWYGAPESRKSVQGDIYSLGVIAYQLLTNQLPLRNRCGELVWPPDLPRAASGLCGMLEKMLALTTTGRYDSCAQARQDLRRTGLIAAHPAPRLSTRLRVWRRRRLGWSDWLLGFVSGLTVAFLLTYVLGWLDMLFESVP